MAATKRRKRFSLAALALLAVASLAPSAEASRYLPNALAPSEAPPAPVLDVDQVDAEAFPLFSETDVRLITALAILDASEAARLSAGKRLRPIADSSEIARPAELAAIEKLASGVLTCESGTNIWQIGCLSQNRGSPSFQGLWTDPLTGIAYARNRWYDPRTASWLSEDPMGAVDSPNLYAFVGWGPHVGTDPMGLECWGLFGDSNLTCLETLHVPEGGIYSAYRQASEARRDPASSAAVRGSMGLLQGLSSPAALFEEYVWRGAANTPHRIGIWMESGSEDLVEGDAAQKSIGFSKYCAAFCEVGAWLIPASSEMRVVSAQAPGMIRRWGSGIRRWFQRNISGTSDEFSLAVRQGARGFSAEIGQGSPNHFGLGLDDAVPEGVVYRRIDMLDNVRPYIGKSKSEARFLARQREEILQYKKLGIDVDFRFEIVDRAESGFSLGLTEESWIRLEGGPTNKSNPFGLLSNRRYEMNQQRYLEGGGVMPRPEGSVGR